MSFAADDEGWITITGKKRTGSNKVPVVVQASVERRAESNAHEGALKQKRVDPASIAELVKARLALGWTQEATDAACAMPKNTIKKIESGHLVPLGGYLRAISRALKVNLRLI